MTLQVARELDSRVRCADVALGSSLGHCATETLQLDDFWFVDNRGSVLGPLPAPRGTLTGSGVVPWRYNLNTGEGNEVVYNLLLDQAWSRTAIETESYFRDWTRRRYSKASRIPPSLFQAWELLRAHVYDNRGSKIPSAGVGVYQLAPRLTSLVDRTFHSPAPTALHYDPGSLKDVWSLIVDAAADVDSLWKVLAFQLDIVDVTRRVMSNACMSLYVDFVAGNNRSMQSLRHSEAGFTGRPVAVKGQALLDFLDSLDLVLSTQGHFSLDKWLTDAQRWANATDADKLIAFNARSQITVLGKGWLSCSCCECPDNPPVV